MKTVLANTPITNFSMRVDVTTTSFCKRLRFYVHLVQHSTSAVVQVESANLLEAYNTIEVEHRSVVVGVIMQWIA